MVKWYSLFSHTGKETESVWRLLDGQLHLEAAITNNTQYRGDLPSVKTYLPTVINEWLMAPGNVEPGSIITLNGYMRIIPAEVLEYLASINCKVYNIHPAPIQLYPDLRGKDPQERMYTGIKEGKYGFIGVVIHAVDSGVDTGEIKHWLLEMADPSLTKEELYQHLHDMGTRAWIEFLKEVVTERGEDS